MALGVVAFPLNVRYSKLFQCTELDAMFEDYHDENSLTGTVSMASAGKKGSEGGF